MELHDLLKESEALSLPCFDLVPAEKGDRVLAHWRGRRSDLPEQFPEFVRALKCQEHFLSVDQEVFDQLGLQGRGPLALSMVTTAEDEERLDHVTVSTGKLNDVVFADSIPLTAKPATSLPPLEALLLYGGAAVEEWLSSQKLHRWEYSDVNPELLDQYLKHFNSNFLFTWSSPPLHELAAGMFLGPMMTSTFQER